MFSDRDVETYWDGYFHLPMVFARGNAPFVLGQEGFFDAFDIAFEKTNRRMVFALFTNAFGLWFKLIEF